VAQRIVFPRKDEVELEEFDLDDVGDGALWLRSTHSLMSTGTEGIALHGLFDDGTHWSRYVRYPFHPGYSTVGAVEAVGPGVTDFAAGDRVVARLGHASDHVVPTKLCTRVPDGVPSEPAVWFGLAKIALMGARAAGYELGDAVAVIGAGPIGQMSVRWASVAGARFVVSVDTVAGRLDLARLGGATGTVAAAVDSAAESVIEACGGRRPRVVVDGTGNAAVFGAALGLVADRGRLVVLGDTGTPAGQHLTSDVIMRGITVVGAHDAHSATGPGWDRDRGLHEFFFELVLSGRFKVEGLTSHVFSPKDCALAYETAHLRRGNTMGIVFDWSMA